MWTAFAFVACGEPSAAPPSAPPPMPPAAAVPIDPGALYESCRNRVEGSEAAGECASDADCIAVGCSGEVCVSKSHADLVTTCEVEPCFQVLEHCACHDTRCTWTLGKRGG